MKPRRQLVLRRENLTCLAPDDMRSVIGGTHIPTDCACITHGNTCDVCNTPTLPLNPCVENVVNSVRYCIAFEETLLCK